LSVNPWVHLGRAQLAEGSKTFGLQAIPPPALFQCDKMKKKLYVTQYAAIFDKQNKILLLRDAIHPKIKGKWIFPGGHINESETDAILALSREIKEETNLDMKSAWVFQAKMKKFPDGIWRFIVYYVCAAKGKVRLSRVHDRFEWVDTKSAESLEFRDKHEKEMILDLLKRKK
jgi:ADP-ribose pyrophosphatase YjhB (NUDIX family)